MYKNFKILSDVDGKLCGSVEIHPPWWNVFSSINIMYVYKVKYSSYWRRIDNNEFVDNEVDRMGNVVRIEKELGIVSLDSNPLDK